MLLGARDLLHVRRGVQHGMPGKIEAGRAAAVEERDLGRIPDAVNAALKHDHVSDAQGPRFGFTDRHPKLVLRHGFMFRAAGQNP